MYLKQLTLRGFKSFASATNLILEPGITCIVGPNGSGKSNIVDALAWVMGEMGAKTLRGSKMDDVIFAGSDSKQSPLGRAEVSLTIDNTDGKLPIEFTEVTIKRTMFRGGGSEYEINGEKCRLLDIQELLSDTGLGQQMHVIVGQGRLDRILQATPIDRRGFIEEAAGVLKHRKRKEKALNKLDGMQANLTRLTDLAAEVRRQLGPLGRQADVAARANVILATVRDAKSRILADDFVKLQELEKEGFETVSKKKVDLEQISDEISKQTAKIEQLENALMNEDVQKASELLFGLTNLKNKYANLIQLASQRELHFQEPTLLFEGSDPKLLEKSWKDGLEQQKASEKEQTIAEKTLLKAREEREKAENEAQTLSQKVAIIRQSASEKRENSVSLETQIDSLTQRILASEKSEKELDAALKKAEKDLELTSKNVDEKAKAIENNKKEIVQLENEANTAKTNFSNFENEISTIEEVLNNLSTQIAVQKATIQSYEEAIKTRVGGKSVQRKSVSQKSAIDSLKTIGVNFDDLKKSVGEDFLIASNSKTAKLLVEASDEFTVVTVDGEIMFFEHDSNEELIPIIDKINAATKQIEKFEKESARHSETLENQNLKLEKLKELSVLAQDSLTNSNSSLNKLNNEMASLVAQKSSLERILEDAKKQKESSLQELQILKQQKQNLSASLTAIKSEDKSSPESLKLAIDSQALAEVALAKAREEEQKAAEEYASLRSKTISLTERAAEKQRQFESEVKARESQAEQDKQREKNLEKAKQIRSLLAIAVKTVESAVEKAQSAKNEILEKQTSNNSDLATLRASLSAEKKKHDEMFEQIHKMQLDSASIDAKMSSLKEKIEEELGVDASTLASDFGPHLPILTPNPDDENKPFEIEFNRAEQEARLKKSERELASLGKVNPLALEEFQALEERHRYLADQLQDLEKSRKDLLELISEIDQHTISAFMAAFNDTAKEFESVFTTLFPGGKGEMLLTDPENPLTTGVEIHATPAGKRISRLSLLSGGERSLVAVAMLVAIFKARPSPFYVMDEVEAALDDVNLSRLLTIFKDLKKSSQILIVTHQKRTMEVADSLYGITMRKDGITQVISQKLA